MTAYVFGRSGNQSKANLALEQLERAGQHRPLDPLCFAVAYIGVGNNDKAMVWLERAYAKHSSSLSAIKVDPTYDPVRGDPRFQDLVRRIGLAQ
jgi:serine/threonine-protein kinase